MDPVCHTLVGGALAQSGLKERTALGTVTLLVGANLPDIDVLAILWGSETGLWFRRGATHGLLAVVVLPVIWTGAVVVWDRWLRGRLRRRKTQASPTPGGTAASGSRPGSTTAGSDARPTGAGGRSGSKADSGERVRPGSIFGLALIAVATHPVLDALNVYGMRWLMPFSDRWSYGDTLFIVDPWVWAILASGLVLSRHVPRGTEEGRSPTRRPIPARLSLVVLAVYILLMAGSNLAARRHVVRTAGRLGLDVNRLMVAPVAVNPFRRHVVIESANGYRVGEYRWLPRPELDLYAVSYRLFPSSPAVAAAIRGPKPRKFLSWARFPFAEVETRPDERLIHIGDLRYTLDPTDSWAAVTVRFDR